jgi:hypothetical protein
MQYDLTVMKLAKESMLADTKTVESYIKKQEDLISKLDDKEIRPKLAELYRKFGMLTDEEKIEAEIEDVESAEGKLKAVAYRKKKSEEDLQAGVDKIADANYFKAPTRFKNRDLSAYVLAKSQTEDGKKIFNINDASILWFQAHISEVVEQRTYRGSAPANLTEASTRVAQMTGVAGVEGMSLEELEVNIKAQQQVMHEEFDYIAATFDDGQRKACSELAICVDCSDDEKARAIDTKSKALNKAVAEIMANLQKDEKKMSAKIDAVMAALPSVEVSRDPAEVKDAEKSAATLTKKEVVVKLSDSQIAKIKKEKTETVAPEETGARGKSLKEKSDSISKKQKLMNARKGISSKPRPGRGGRGKVSKEGEIPMIQLDEVVITVSKKALHEKRVKANTKRFVTLMNAGELKGFAKVPEAPVGKGAASEKSRAITQDIGRCRATYTVSNRRGVRTVKLRIATSGENLVCTSKYVVSAKDAEKSVWDEAKVRELCAEGHDGIDLKAICEGSTP